MGKFEAAVSKSEKPEVRTLRWEGYHCVSRMDR